MKVSLYARVSTRDKDQNPEVQLARLNDYCAFQGWEIGGTYVDYASAVDLRGRTRWGDLMNDVMGRRVKAVLVFKMDRAFRSVKDMHDHLSVWDKVGCKFLSAQEQFDTSTAIGRLLLNLLASLAEFELELIRERVLAGMELARKQGKLIHRPRLEEKDVELAEKLAEMIPRVHSGEITKSDASKELGMSRATLNRRMDEYLPPSPSRG